MVSFFIRALTGFSCRLHSSEKPAGSSSAVLQYQQRKCQHRVQALRLNTAFKNEAVEKIQRDLLRLLSPGFSSGGDGDFGGYSIIQVSSESVAPKYSGYDS